jgi:hypothetical protein
MSTRSENRRTKFFQVRNTPTSRGWINGVVFGGMWWTLIDFPGGVESYKRQLILCAQWVSLLIPYLDSLLVFPRTPGINQQERLVGHVREIYFLEPLNHHLLCHHMACVGYGEDIWRLIMKY